MDRESGNEAFVNLRRSSICHLGRNAIITCCMLTDLSKLLVQGSRCKCDGLTKMLSRSVSFRDVTFGKCQRWVFASARCLHFVMFAGNVAEACFVRQVRKAILEQTCPYGLSLNVYSLKCQLFSLKKHAKIEAQCSGLSWLWRCRCSAVAFCV